jgi:hypothetical protein
MKNEAESESVWAMVLASGDGERTKEFLRR